MNPKVLRQNYNFPFRTDEDFVWYLAFQGRKLLGFVPVETKRSEYVINNYYTPGRDADMLRQLLQEVIEQTAIMSYFDEAETKNINQMWINIRCFHIADVPVGVWLLVTVIVLALAVAYMHHRRNQMWR